MGPDDLDLSEPLLCRWSPRLRRAFQGEGQYVLVIPIVFMEFMTVMLAAGVLPQLEYDYFGSRAVLVGGLVSGVAAFLSFFTQPIIGTISDRIGRKWLLLCTSTATALPHALLIFHNNLIVYCVMQAMCGALSATMVLAHAYIADCTAPETRAKRLAVLMAAFGLVMIVAPLTGSLVYANLGRTALFGTVAAVMSTNILYIVLLLPESNRDAKSRVRESVATMTWADMSPIRPLRLLNSNPILRRIAVMVALTSFANTGWFATILIYSTQALGFGPKDTGIMLGTFGISAFLSSAVGVRVLNPLLGERALMMLSLFASMVQMIVFGLARDRVLIMVCAACTVVSALGGPPLNALATSAANVHVQGQVMGALGAVTSNCKIAAPILYGTALNLCAGTAVPGLPYTLGSVLFLAALVLSWSLPKSVSDITVVDDYAEMKDLAEEDDQDVEDIVPDEEEDLGSMLQRTDLRDFALGSSAYAVAESTGDMVQLLQPQR